MNVKVLLSEESILSAIHRLNAAKSNLRFGLNDAIEVLVKDGEGEAQSRYGRTANAVGYMQDEYEGVIAVTGETNLIAEFGAGDTTIPPDWMFENKPDTDVYPGAYSEQVGTGEYARTGVWHFGGREYREVEPRLGLYYAKEYVIDNAARIAKEVIKL